MSKTMHTALTEARDQWEKGDTKRYDRDAIPEVWHAYCSWRTEHAEAYPYNADIEAWIIKQYEVADSLRDHLGTEVYLAQQQRRREEKAARDEEMAADGFVPITRDVEYRGPVHVRAKKETDFMASRVSEYGKFVDGSHGSAFFIPKGRRTRGFSLVNLKGYYKPIA